MNYLKTTLLVIAVLLFAEFAHSQDLRPLNEDSLKTVFKDNDDKIVVVNLWAFWCAPCKEEFPELVQFGKQNEKDAKLIFVSLDTKQDLEGKTKPFLKSNNVDFASYYNDFDKDEKLINMLDENWEGAIPSTFYFKNGKLVKSLIGKQNLETFEKTLKEAQNN